ncbi:hypothetical protein ACEP28_32795 [Pseudomonas aeruginosa]|uniref:hypothetical protein n=1 Tax=Pseudomonadaceae TaxID=135621 RepID=UPI000B5AA7D9|nr:MULTISPECIES: hypothetical protein [Pseudomonas aeruginosa group]ELN4741133.1 hypothetical protein [Escherichia coli]ASJ88847.1 hypothetical protein PSA83_06721 [Pseudomonas aeruginosa]EKU6307999.1 hypothetical protein [Pseudomonas aeruginosa]EKX2969450.1 hypothetical protein [Pseudomonas aeruginosa]BDC78416.1 hypothetical protein MRCP2_p1510 [Pseudomonas alcaligenes]
MTEKNPIETLAAAGNEALTIVDAAIAENGQAALETVNAQAVEAESDYYTEEQLNTVVNVQLTLRDLTILSWGHEAVSFVPGEENDLEFQAASKKIDAALDEARDRAAQL